MLLNWFHTRKVTELGGSLADHLIAQAASGGQRKKPSAADQKAVHSFLRKVDQEARPLRLNLFKRAKLANAFKWRLLEKGAEPGRVDELTRMLLLQLGRNGASGPKVRVAETATPKRVNASQVASLLAKAIEFGAQGAHAEAMRCYQELLELDPRNALAHNNLGVALLILGRYRDAEQAFRRAIEIKRGYPDALSNLATVLRWTGSVLESEAPLRRALKLNPKHAQAQVNLGLTLVLVGRIPDAKECFENAIKSAPGYLDAWVGAAELAEIEGRFKEAEALLNRALDIQPMSPNAWAAQARLRKMTPADGAWMEKAERIIETDISFMDETTLRFAMGKYCDDVKEFKSAFQHYQRANELLKLTARPYDREARKSFVDDLVRAYPREVVSKADSGISNSERPVFVVGMMRSGTSLVEQIISSHPDAKGAGEVDFWARTVQKHEITLRRGLPGEPLRRQWAAAYLETLSRHSPDALRVVDKSNFNSDILGIIHSVFPKARFIHLQRDPLDTCLSCYFQQFAAFLNFTMDLSDLAHYYREHRRLVDHWRAALPPETLLEVPYAGLIGDQENWTRKILDFLGLSWDASCLSFHETNRPVLTASAWQVRQKIYKGSVGRWQNYRKFIGPLLELADTADC